MRVTVTLDYELLRTAREFTGISDHSLLLNQALRALVEHEAGRKLLERAGTMPELEDICRLRANDL